MVQNQEPYIKFYIVFPSQCFSPKHQCAARYRRLRAQGETTLSRSDVGQKVKRKEERDRQTENLGERDRDCKKEITYRKGMVRES